ncbi:MAG: DUF4350 domain-containing protein [Gemmatimonadaceae bacterium]
MSTIHASARRAIALALLAAPLRTAGAQQVADTAFRASIPAPAYAAGAGPLVLLDEAHTNFHTLDGRYLAFGNVLRQDGFTVRPNRAPFSRTALGRARVLVVANALNTVNAREWKLPTPSAFTAAEVAAVRDWVRDGGSLLLVADHMPFPGAAHDLAEAFGIHMLNGFAYDSTRTVSKFRYRRSDGSLGAHAVTEGRSLAERIDSVVAFTGQAFRVDAPGTPLMTLAAGTIVLEPKVAWQFDAGTPAEPGAGLLQGAVVPVGKGRVAVFGEAAMFSAQVAGPRRNPMGMNDPAAPQNAQFLLNVMHWLTGLLGP